MSDEEVVLERLAQRLREAREAVAEVRGVWEDGYYWSQGGEQMLYAVAELLGIEP